MGDWLDRYRVYILIVLLVTIAAGSALLLLRSPRPAPIRISTPVPTLTPTTTPTPTPAPLRVYVTGAVHKPDVYVLAAGSIVKEALAAAGGATTDADLERINLAVQLVDQQQVYVPRQGEGTSPVSPVAAPPPAAQPLRSSTTSTSVNINTATAAELETLPGIGPAFAQRIIEYREAYGAFATIEDLSRVKGIGPATCAKLEGLIAVR